MPPYVEPTTKGSLRSLQGLNFAHENDHNYIRRGLQQASYEASVATQFNDRC